MRRIFLLGILLASLGATACAFENSSKLNVPTAPDNVGGTGGTGASGGTSTGGSTGGSSTGGSNNGGNSGSSTSPVSAFTGAWGASSFAGLPLGNCSNVKWVMTAQTATSLTGTVTANCDSGVTVAANLSGTMAGANMMNIDANGTLTMAGVPCPFNIIGTGTRQTNDSMKVDYIGTYCLGNVSGSETLRRFPDL